MLDFDPSKIDQPWDAFWSPQAEKYRGKVAILDDSREAPGMALMRRGVTDLNTEDPDLLAQAGRTSSSSTSKVGVKVSIADYETVPAGRVVLHQGWSGDMIAGVISYMPKGVKPDVLSYWYQKQGGPIFNDCICVATNATKPVIAHRFLNYMLDNKVAYENFAGYVGYQPPITAIDASKLFDDGIIPKTLEPGRRDARGLRQRQRLPDALGQGPAALGPHLGVVPQRLMGSRWIWRALALPGLVWLALFFVVAFYAIISVGLGNVTTLYEPVPHWNPLDWNVGYIWQALKAVLPGGDMWHTFLRTIIYVVVAVAALAGHRLPGRVVRRAPRRALARADPRAARPALLDQLPDADVRVDEPARRATATRRARCTRCRSTRCSRSSGCSTAPTGSAASTSR